MGVGLISLGATLQKNALQWTKSPTEADTATDGTGASTASTANPTASTTGTTGGTTTNATTTATSGPGLAHATAPEGAEQESCDSTETTANASGENDGRLMSWGG